MSEQKEITIVVPDGYEVDEAKSTYEKIVFKKKVTEFPISWEDLKVVNGYSITGNSSVYAAINCHTIGNFNKNVFPSIEEANAMLAMAQLCQLRDAWNGDWKPDFDNGVYKYGIEVWSNKLTHIRFYSKNKPMYFKTPELRDKFMETFVELLEIAKPFL